MCRPPQEPPADRETNNELTQPRIWLENTYVPETVSVGPYVLSVYLSDSAGREKYPAVTCSLASLCLATMWLVFL